MKLNEQARPLRSALPLLLAATCSMETDDTPLDHHQVKASYLFNLLRFIDWPDDVCPLDGALSLYICGAYSLEAFFALHGARVGDRTITVQRIKEKDLTAGRLPKCHILVISGEAPIVSVPVARGLLTVGETDGFTACGGIVNLLVIAGRARFQFNEKLAQACGFVISPKLARLSMR